MYGERVQREFAGECVSASAMPGVTRMRAPNFSNSGAAAISLAASRGARRIVMVGYDCQRTGGATHHHGDHPRPLSNAKSMPLWAGRFRDAARHLAQLRVEVINASRVTALTCFKRSTLEDALAADRLHDPARQHRSAA